MNLCYPAGMRLRWLQWNPDRAGIIGALFSLTVIVCLFALLVIYIPDLKQRAAGAGFGPDWDCAAQPRGDPVCIKKPGR
jgi:hypothetical protein